MPTFESLDLERLLAPIDAAAPCGEDLAFSSEIDAIQRARQADDPSIEQGAWVTDLKEADWKFVAKQCTLLIDTRSKDLQLAVWLAEAGAKTGGLRALGDSLLLVAMLCERWWDELYPALDDGGAEQRIGNLAWVAARGAQWVREIPLTSGPDGVALRDVEAARAQGAEAAQARIDAARKRGLATFYAALLDDVQHCLAAVERLGQRVDERLGADGPGFGALRTSLEDAQDFLRPLAQQGQARAAGAAGQAAGALAVQPAASLVGAGSGGDVGANVGNTVQARAQALAQLRAVAEFFRCTEPHSPVAYLAEKAAAWGEQPLHVWLRGVIKDDASFAHVQELLGVAAGAE